MSHSSLRPPWEGVSGHGSMHKSTKANVQYAHVKTNAMTTGKHTCSTNSMDVNNKSSRR